MTITTEYPVVKIKYHMTPEQESTTIDYLIIPERARNALVREKINTIGEIIERWTSLHVSRIPGNKRTNIGLKSVKEIRAAVCRWMLEEGCVSGFSMDTTNCREGLSDRQKPALNAIIEDLANIEEAELV